MALPHCVISRCLSPHLEGKMLQITPAGFPFRSSLDGLLSSHPHVFRHRSLPQSHAFAQHFGVSSAQKSSLSLSQRVSLPTAQQGHLATNRQDVRYVYRGCLQLHGQWSLSPPRRPCPPTGEAIVILQCWRRDTDALNVFSKPVLTKVKWVGISIRPHVPTSSAPSTSCPPALPHQP